MIKFNKYLIALIMLPILMLLPFYFLHLENSSEEQNILTLSGKLCLKLFPGPPEYSSIEDGDRADYCWVLQLDDKSYTLAMNVLAESINPQYPYTNEIMLATDEIVENNYPLLRNQQITVSGLLFEAHTVHHYTPLFMEVSQIL